MRACITNTLILIAASLILGCGAAMAPGPGPRGTVRFTSNVPEATLEVDETRIGPIGMFEKSGLLLKPGQHRVIVRHGGHFTEYQLIEVVEGDLLVVDVQLRAVPD